MTSDKLITVFVFGGNPGRYSNLEFLVTNHTDQLNHSYNGNGSLTAKFSETIWTYNVLFACIDNQAKQDRFRGQS